MERRLAQAGVRIGDPGTAVVLAAAGLDGPGRDGGDLPARHGVAACCAAGATWSPPSRPLPRHPPPKRSPPCARAAHATVVVASYLLAPGVFADKVRETSLAAGAAAVSGVLAAAPELADLVLWRYAAASAATTRLARPAGAPLRNLA